VDAELEFRKRAGNGRARRVGRALAFACFWGLACAVVAAGGATVPADAALEGADDDPYVSGACRGRVSAGYVDRRLRVEWRLEDAGCGGTNRAGSDVPRVVLSTDAPGHWPVRDWRSWPMTAGAGGWEARIPLVSATAPVVYFVESVAGGVTNASAMRCFRPVAAGVMEATSPFTGHLDGFEQGLVGWEWGGSGDGAEWMALTEEAWTGRWAMRVTVPRGRASATVGTVRLRSWMLEGGVAGRLVMAARTTGGEGRLRFALHGNARTSGLAVYPAKGEEAVGPVWRRVEVPLERFVNLRPWTVDWLTIQFVADAGRVVVLDDLELEVR
jgi:hypothetical protein